MTFKKKVIWSEGMFLRPQHFQQQDRHFDSALFQQVRLDVAHFWGFQTLEFDAHALVQGIVSVRRAQGRLPDGTWFSVPDLTPAPADLDVPLDIRSCKVCLAVAPLREGVPTVAFEEVGASAARFAVHSVGVDDCNTVGGGPADIQVGDLHMRLVSEDKVPAGWSRVGVLRVHERQANNVLVLDGDHIPPTLCVRRQPVLAGMLREVTGLLSQRVDALSLRMTDPTGGGMAEVTDFLLLGLANRWKAVFEHLSVLDGLHPERLYADFLALAGELATYAEKTRRAPAFAVYDHDDLAGTFRAVFASLRQSLSMVLEQSAVRIQLVERGYGVQVAQIHDRHLLTSASFVLAVSADAPMEQVRAQLPAHLKIGPVEKIRDLVNLHLPGVGVRPLPLAPRELPYSAGYNYFEIETGHELWRELHRSGGMALHVSNVIPGLQIECWAIKRG